MKRPAWYVAGLHFECTECGACCSGPGEGVIWVQPAEIERIARYLGIEVGPMRRRYTRRIGARVTLVEEPQSRDCIFLETQGRQKRCRIYPVRPNQCRTWPFWKANLASPDDWNAAAQGCPGINRGRLYSVEEIECLKRQRQWWSDEDESR